MLYKLFKLRQLSYTGYHQTPSSSNGNKIQAHKSLSNQQEAFVLLDYLYLYFQYKLSSNVTHHLSSTDSQQQSLSDAVEMILL